MKDWLISRQRFWGTPIPVVYCSKCGIIPIKEKDLPVVLPDKIKFDGKGNVLDNYKKFYETKCPLCKGKARRETDTMDTFVNSSWYYLRYCDSKNKREIFDKKKANYWSPIDMYIGGKEHAYLHLIYIRFYTKFLRDLNLLRFSEPAVKLFNQGFLLGNDGEKMSKSKGNVVLPEVISEKYGIDTARLFMVSVASPDKDIQWDESGIEGSVKFVRKLLDYCENVKFGVSSEKIESKVNKTVKEFTLGIENFRYNIAVIKLRDLFESFQDRGIAKKDFESFLKMLSVFCPHVAEELWEKLGNKSFISTSSWPKYDEKKINEKFEKEDELIDNLINDINNILKILQQRRETKSFVKVFVIPNEIDIYKQNAKEIEKRVGLKVEILNIKDSSQLGKQIKAKPGKPGLLLE